MISESLEFEITHNHRTFLVGYESESREKNLLMSIVSDGLPIDTLLLPKYDPELFDQIAAAMKNNADSFWTDEERAEQSKMDKLIATA